MGNNGTLTSLEDFFTCSQEMLFSADREGALLGLSAPLGRMLGAEVGRGTKLSSRVHPDDRRAFRSAWSQLRKSSEPARFDCRLQGADGAYHACSWHARTSAKRGVIHGSLRNGAGERAPLIAEMEKQATILRLVQENIPICVWAIDAQGTFIHHAGKGLATAGLAEGQWVGKNVFELYPDPEGSEGVRRALKGEVSHAISEAHGLHWESWQIPVHDRQGRIDAVVGFTLDVSEARRAQQALRAKLDLIERQQQVIRALSAPIIEVWDRVVTLPLLGVLDSQQAAVMMEALLTQVSKKSARFAILDLTGVDTVDTATAAHVLRLVHAIRLLGAEGVISGIQPAVAQTMVSLGVDLKGISTFATLRDALRFCITRMRDGGAPGQAEQEGGKTGRRAAPATADGG